MKAQTVEAKAAPPPKPLTRRLPAAALILAWAALWPSALIPAPATAQARIEAVTAVMEDPANPLLLLETSQGDLYIELLPAEAPRNVRNILALAAGDMELVNDGTGRRSRVPFYKDMRFHRVVPGFVIQAGSPLLHPRGAPRQRLRDEINADALGLQNEPLILPDGVFNPRLNIGSQEDFNAEVLRPLYAGMGIETLADLLNNEQRIMQTLQEMTVKDVLESQGYRFIEHHPTRPVTRGTVALVNGGPDDNGPEFFIALSDAPSLSGRHTVIGRVVHGMNVADSIGSFAMDVYQTRYSTVIYSMGRIDTAPFGGGNRP